MIIDNPEDKKDKPADDEFKDLASWITARTDEWREHRQQNYDSKWEEYYRIWRGMWSADDRARESERAKLVSPATQQAIESHVSELEEACFGRGNFFDIEDDDAEKQDVEQLKNNLVMDFKRDKIRKAIGDIMLNGAIYGTGVGEIIVKEVKQLAPATQPIPGIPMQAVGTTETTRFSVQLKPIQPNNFLIEPNAKTVDTALGVAVEEFVSRHSIVKGIEDGIYRDVDIDVSADDSRLEPTFATDNGNKNRDKVRVLRYYGLVPADLLKPETDKDADIDADLEDSDDLKGLVEAVVVIVNDGVVIKAEKSPYMMQDRPILAYQDDTVPNSFWGRGIAEKGYNSQKGLDTELRARIDNLALVSVPMMAMDASRLPRGSSFKVKPGGSILTNGNPTEILKPMTFGQLDANSYQQSREFERMLLMATGTTDASSVPAAINGEATAAGMSMALGALIKRQKRALVNFQEGFLIPFVQKAAWRYMQFDPDRYPVKDFSFIPVASMGIMAREYEQSQFVALLQTMGADSPAYPILLRAIVENSSVHNREELLAALTQAMQPNPEAQQAQQQAQQMQMAMSQAQLQESQAKAAKTQAEAQQVSLENQFLPQKIQAEIIAATTNNLPEDPNDKVFNQRLEISDRLLKEREIKTKEKIVETQMGKEIPNGP